MPFCRISVVWICETKSDIADMTEKNFSMCLLEGTFAQGIIMRDNVCKGVGIKYARNWAICDPDKTEHTAKTT